jgi:hypothetical protein
MKPFDRFYRLVVHNGACVNDNPQTNKGVINGAREI